MTIQRNILLVAAVIGAGLLAGCRGEEHRPYVTDKGNYTGPIDNQLTPAQVAELNSRIQLQGAGTISAGANERPQEERPAPDNKQFEQRLREQAGN